jgi:DNA invertase Pin-like site-specific DNA recombinase
VIECFGRRCDPKLGCGRPLRPGDAWTCDHIQAVINGGANRASEIAKAFKIGRASVYWVLEAS